MISYLQLFASMLMWSFVGVMVKSASQMVDCGIISFCRFFFGVVFLWLFLLMQRKPIGLYYKDKWIWIGVAGKSLNYILENLAIAIGFVYAQVIVWPVMMIFLTFYAIIFFGEKINSQKTVAIVLCLIGISLVSWKGMPLEKVFGGGLIPTLLLAASAIGGGIHMLASKKLVTRMDSGNLNLSTFFFASLVTVVPMPITFSFSGIFNPWSIASLIGLGFITGMSFYLYAESLRNVPFLVATIISNSCVLFTLVWSRLFYKEDVNGYVISGVIILLSGLIIINIPKKVLAKEAELTIAAVVDSTAVKMQ
jgi:drug/metabolite transporter (DMT)-like permease